jgi:hypothetical protein
VVSAVFRLLACPVALSARFLPVVPMRTYTTVPGSIPIQEASA